MDGPLRSESEANAARREELLVAIERRTELPLMVLAFVMIPLLAAPIFWDLRPLAWAVVLTLDGLIWALFAADLAAKVAVAPERLRYVRENWFEVLTALIPVARPLRLVRMALYGSRAYRGVLRLARVDFLLVYAVGLVLLVATTMTFVERDRGSDLDSFSDALWWAVVTVTAVGYGDIVPESQAGRALAYVLMLGGVGLFGALTANLATSLIRRDSPGRAEIASLIEENRALREELARARESGGEHTG